VLKIVDEDQQLAFAQIGRQAVGARSVGPITLRQRRCDLGSDQRRIRQPFQSHEHRASLIVRLLTPANLHQEPRLPDPARPGQRDQSNVGIGQQLVKGVQLLAPSDQSCQRPREPRGR
jgi:hypothetical protein